MKTLILILYILQPDTLPPAAELYASLTRYHLQQTAADLAEFATSTSGNWMSWMPSVGLAYTPSGEPRPGINYSLATVFSNIKAKQHQQAKREAILKKNQLLYEADRRELTAALSELEQLQADYQFALQIHAIDSTLYEVEQRKLDNAEIMPTDFLEKQRSFLLKEQTLREKRREMEMKELEITQLARHSLENIEGFTLSGQ